MLNIIERSLNYKLSNPLVFRLLFQILLFSSLITLLGTSIQLYLYYKEDRNFIQQQFEQIKNSHLNSLANSLWYLDKKQLEFELNGILGFRDVEYLEIDTDGEIIVSAGKPPELKNFIVHNFPLSHTYRGKSYQLGHLSAVATLEGVHTRLVQKALVILATQGIKTFLVSMFILFIFHYLITRHLITMANYARRFNMSKIDTPLALDRNIKDRNHKDELEEVVSAINDMRTDLKKYIADRKKSEIELQKAYDDLETKVANRTADIVRVNDQLKSEVEERKRVEEKLTIYHGQLRALSSKLLLVEEHERRHIATDLHDSIGQSLAIIKMKMAALKDSNLSTEQCCILEESLTLIGRTIQETRSLTFELSPPILYELGFEPAIEWLCDQIQQKHGIIIRFKDDELHKPLDESSKVLLFRAIRELLYNIVKHAKAKTTTVSIQKKDKNINIFIEDDGVGFDKTEPGHSQKGFGLFSISERLSHLGGRLSINSIKGRGSHFIISAPINETPD